MPASSLLCRLAATVPLPRFHTVRYAGVLSSHAKWRPLVVPKPAPAAPGDDTHHDRAADTDAPRCASRYRPWAELLRRTFGIDIETCPRCGGRMRLLALVTEPKNVAPCNLGKASTGTPGRRTGAKDDAMGGLVGRSVGRHCWRRSVSQLQFREPETSV